VVIDSALRTLLFIPAEAASGPPRERCSWIPVSTANPGIEFDLEDYYDLFGPPIETSDIVYNISDLLTMSYLRP
jgi:hypothetical protein